MDPNQIKIDIDIKIGVFEQTLNPAERDERLKARQQDANAAGARYPAARQSGGSGARDREQR